MDEAKQRAIDLHHEAVDCLSDLGEKAEPLREISEYIISRQS
jgi:geranylgeranyl pyrophosphate synthase